MKLLNAALISAVIAMPVYSEECIDKQIKCIDRKLHTCENKEWKETGCEENEICHTTQKGDAECIVKEVEKISAGMSILYAPTFAGLVGVSLVSVVALF
ncbi:hypothetical protein AYI69_g569 [Smittium culicis]|uniref:Extracellular membrane protein CFEM domain-containing protein n=1 Tax=Smittium culicis TaxID=133412 RepID=A0A1R1YSN8_9FUNG|nr:hypothetical protein AYI69_g569 [Smittium culicis]